MDDTPRAFIEEFRAAILKKRVGQIAIAVVLAEAVWRFLNALTWYLIMPIIGRFLQGQTESVLFPQFEVDDQSLGRTFPAPILEFLLTIIVVFYANRWIHAKSHGPEDNVEAEYSLVGEPVELCEQPDPARRLVWTLRKGVWSISERQDIISSTPLPGKSLILRFSAVRGCVCRSGVVIVK